MRVSRAGVDPLLVIGALGLSVLGIVLVWSAAGARSAVQQGLSLAIGLLAAASVSRVPFHMFRVAAPWCYVATVVGVLVTLTPLGSTRGGARAWLELPGGFTVQPSEFAKLGLILLLAAVGSAGVFEAGRGRATLQSLGLAGVLLVLVLLQNDTGTALVLAVIAAAVIAVAGAPRSWLLAAFGAAVAGSFAVIRLELLQGYQLARLTSFLQPDADGLGAGYNVLQARIAIAGGGLFGQGLFRGVQTQGGFVPVNDSDFVFTVAAEELGLAGALLLLGLLSLVVWRAVQTAVIARDLFSRLVATGVAAWFGFQAFENIGMNLGIMPVAGVTLPFVSAGGSSLIACWSAVGVLHVLRARQLRRRRRTLIDVGSLQY